MSKLLVKIFLFASFVLCGLVFAQSTDESRNYPFTIEGASIEILIPAQRINDGLLKISTDEACDICSQKFVFTKRAKILIASTGMQMSSIELAEHVHKLASVHIIGPNEVGGFSFSN